MMNNQQPPVIIQQQPVASSSSNNNNKNNNNNQQFQAQRVKATEKQFKLFTRGIDATLQQWTALNLVCLKKGEKTNGIVNNNNSNNNNAFGVPQVDMFQDQQQQKTFFHQGPANLMRQDLYELFSEQGEIFSDELEDYFHEFFESERAAYIEDGSLKEVADSLHEMYRRCCVDDDSNVLRLEHSLIAYQQSNTLGQCVNFGGNNNDEDDDDDDDGDAALLDEYDDDGNYIGDGDDYDDEEYYEEDECYVDEDGAPPQENSMSKNNKNNKKKNNNNGWKTMGNKK